MIQALFIASVLPVILIGTYIYKKDKEKEPTKLLVSLFIGGIGACFLTLFLSLILGMLIPFFNVDQESLNRVQLLVQVFLGVALVEEFSKWIILYKISYKNKAFDELYDALLYGMFVALGFACFENLLYVFSDGFGVALTRGLLAVPGHACDGMFMGYFLGQSKIGLLYGDKQKQKNNLLLSVLVPTITHGIYDYLLFEGSVISVIVFFIFVILIYIYVYRKIKAVSSINRKMKYEYNYCPNCGHIVESNFCPKCGRENK